MVATVTYCAVLCVIALGNLFFITRAIRSKRSISKEVVWVLGFAEVPLITNIFSVIVNTYKVAMIMNGVYLLSLAFLYYAVFMFVMRFCHYTWGGSLLKNGLFILCAINGIVILANPIYHHLFDVTTIQLAGRTVYGGYDYHMYAYAHFVLLFALAGCVLFTLIHKIINTSFMVADRYLFILATFAVSGFCGLYVDSNAGYNASLVFTGLYCLLIYYYGIEHVPVQLLDRMKSTIVSTVKDSILFFDENRSCIYANNSARMIFDITDDSDMESIRSKIIDSIDETEESITNLKNKRATVNYSSGNINYVFEAEYHKLFDGKGKRIGSFVCFNDITEVVNKMKREHYLAAHDQLTGLYNSRHFYDTVNERLREVNPEDYVAVITDIRGFKLINDRYGHEVGDKILKDIANVVDERCRISTRTIYARITADRFGIFTHKDLVDKVLINKIFDDVKDRIGSEYSVVIHAGIYEFTSADYDSAVAFDRALMAIGSIKNNLEERISYYSSEMRANLDWEEKINASLDEAIRKGQIVPYLQAQVDGTGNIIGAEVLVRWVQDNGVIPPFRFIPVLEKNGTIAKVDLHMWERACQILNRWDSEGMSNKYLSVNISPRDFYVLDVVEELKNLVEKYKIDPKRLRLEITESVMMDDAVDKFETIAKLRELGFIIEMDDFGSGYSSLNMLKDMPVDVIKLDMMFMSKTANQERTDIIVNLIVKLAYDLGLSVIAEGVETKEQYENLMGMGCRSFQGYYFAKPTPLSDFETSF